MDRSTLHALPLVLVAMMLIPAGDTAGKVLTSGGVAPVFVAWSRFALGALLLAPFAIRAVDPRLFLDWRVWVRALFIVCGIVSILTALRTEPIANVFGAFFVGPSSRGSCQFGCCVNTSLFRASASSALGFMVSF